MPTTTYRSHVVGDLLAAAQSVIDRHIISSLNGQCLLCQVDGPCPTREQAAATFARYGHLPRRTPGATRPELVNARRSPHATLSSNGKEAREHR